MTDSSWRFFRGRKCLWVSALLAFALWFPLNAPAQGIITTAAGGGPNSPVALSADVGPTYSVAVDKFGNIFVASPWLDQVFEVNGSGNVSLVVGIGVPAYSGDGGTATNASLPQAFVHTRNAILIAASVL